MNMVDTIENAALEEWLTDKEIEFIRANAGVESTLLEGKVLVYGFEQNSPFEGIQVLKLTQDLSVEEAMQVFTLYPDTNLYHATKCVYIGGERAKNPDLLLNLIKFLATKDETFATKMHNDYLHFGSLTEEFEEDEESHRFYTDVWAIYQYVESLEAKSLVLFENTLQLRASENSLCVWDYAQKHFFVFAFNPDTCSVYLRDLAQAPACQDADWSAIEKSVTSFDKIGQFNGSKTVGATKEFYTYLESVQCLVVDYLLSHKLIEKINYYHDDSDLDYLEEAIDEEVVDELA